MQHLPAAHDGLLPESVVTSRIAFCRLGIGLLQGVLLYVLYRTAETAAWSSAHIYLFVSLLLLGMFVPVLLITSLGHLKKEQIMVWMMAAAVIIGALGCYDIWRGGEHEGWFGIGRATHPHFPSPLLFIVTAAGFYIAHTLVLAGALDQRRFARYPTYFETAWKLLIQISFSAPFVGVLWLVLGLGGALFMLVKVDFLLKLLQKPWFAIPVTAFAFSCALHITDVRPAIVRGIRSLLLVLLSWLLPVITLIVAGFLLTLPWTGLAPLWATRHATAVLLGAAAVLIVLINAAFQNGEAAAGVARIVRISARVAALSLLPVVVIAIYALSLRVQQYGWTTDRIISAACLLVASCYAAGYAWAACRKGIWLGPVSMVNVASAFVVLAVLLLLLSPVGDPARLSVQSQVARLTAGKVSAAKFDFNYLRFDGARYGLTALKQLQTWTHGTDAALIRERAAMTLKKQSRWQTDVPKLTPATLVANIDVWPKTASLPASFVQQKWSENKHRWELPQCLTQSQRRCNAYPMDVDGDGKPEILLIGAARYQGNALMKEGADGHWDVVGSVAADFAGCERLRRQLQAGEFQLVVPRWKDIEIGGQRVEIQHRMATDAAACHFSATAPAPQKTPLPAAAR